MGRILRRVAAWIGAGALVLLAACGGGGGGGGGGGAGEVAVSPTGEGLSLVLAEYRFVPETLTVKAGEDVELTIINQGAREHELMIGRPAGGGPAWEEDLLARMEPEVLSGEGYKLAGFPGMEGMEEHEEEAGMEEHGGAEIEVEAGGRVTLVLHVPADATGEWEMGCFLPQHYERGMKGTLVVE